MPYATIENVRIYVPDLEAEDEGAVNELLEQAEAEILIEFPDLEARIADGRTLLIHVRRVEAEMVSSVMRNRSGYASASENIGGELANSYTINTKVASGLMELTEAQRNLIRGTSAGTGSAFTVRPGAGAPRRRGW